MTAPVTVTCLSARPLNVDPATRYEDVVERTISFWEQRLAAVVPDSPDLIVLPEAVDRPDVANLDPDWQRAYFEHRGTRIQDWFAERARELGCHIAYSSQLPTDQGALRNSTVLLSPAGDMLSRYDKAYLVVEENTDLGLEYGDKACVVDTTIGRVGAIICFDLNFTDLLEEYRHQHPKLMVFSSEYHGGLMQNYWAYQLRSYLAASIRPPAPSAVVSPLGETIGTSTNYFDHVTQRIDLDYEVVHLDSLFPKLAEVKRRYGPELQIHDPGRLGSVLVTSTSVDFSAHEVLAEMDIEDLDTYLQRSQKHRAGALKP